MSEFLFENLSDAAPDGPHFQLAGGRFIKPMLWTAEDLELLTGAPGTIELDKLVAAYDSAVPDRSRSWRDWLTDSRYRNRLVIRPSTKDRIQKYVGDLLEDWKSPA